MARAFLQNLLVQRSHKFAAGTMLKLSGKIRAYMPVLTTIALAWVSAVGQEPGGNQVQLRVCLHFQCTFDKHFFAKAKTPSWHEDLVAQTFFPDLPE